jgi:hypothetical protein
MLPTEIKVGHVFRYSYLWHWQYLEGREEGDKDRPCLARIRRPAAGDRERLLLWALAAGVVCRDQAPVRRHCEKPGASKYAAHGVNL